MVKRKPRAPHRGPLRKSERIKAGDLHQEPSASGTGPALVKTPSGDSSVPAFRSPLPRLRVGSELITRHGAVFRIREAVILVSERGALSHSVVVERVRDGRLALYLLTIGVLANLTRGATHKPSASAVIDWERTPRRPMAHLRGTNAMHSSLSKLRPIGQR